MDDVLGVHVLNSLGDLEQEVLRLDFRDRFPPLDEFRDGLVDAESQHDVDIVGVFKEILHFDDVLVVQLIQYFDFRDDLALGSFLQVVLRYDLPSEHFASLQVSHFETSGESPFAQMSPFDERVHDSALRVQLVYFIIWLASDRISIETC